MARLGTPCCVALREQNSCQCEACLSQLTVNWCMCDRLANKQDVDGALSEGDICDRLNLESLANHYETPCRVASIPVLCLEEGEY